MQRVGARPWRRQAGGPPARPAGRASNPPSRPAAPARGRLLCTDGRNLGLIVLGSLALLLVLPPAHDYPIIDDWVYAGSVRHQLATGTFQMPPGTEATLLGLTLWGTLWARLFGFSYTALTASTLVLALVALVACYGLARLIAVPPGGALLATALLAGQPLFLHLSFSFMTDVPALALLLLACYGYLRGVRGDAAGWWALGGLAAGGAFLIRQFALLVPAAFLLYLLLDGVRTRRLRVAPLLGVALGPALVGAAWWLGLPGARPSPLLGAALGHPAWLEVCLARALASLPILGLAAPALRRLRRADWWLVGLWGGLVAAGWVVVTWVLPHRLRLPTSQFHVPGGPLGFDLATALNPFLGAGNVLRTGGIDFFDYHQEPLWTPAAWSLLFLGASALGVLLLAQISAAVRAGWRGRCGLDGWPPRASLYLTGLVLSGVTLSLPASLYDRYLLVCVPFVLLFAVRDVQTWGRLRWLYATAVVVGTLTWGIFLQADAQDHDNARWQAGAWLAARTPALHAGYDWDQGRPVRARRAEVADVALPGFQIVACFPYHSRLAGFRTRYVLAQLPAPGGAGRDMPTGSTDPAAVVRGAACGSAFGGAQGRSQPGGKTP